MQNPKFIRNIKFQNKLLAFIFLSYAIITSLAIVVEGSGGTAQVTASVVVGTTCTFTTSNSAINFGTVSQGQHTSGTVNVLTVTNTGFNPSNILVSSSNWAYNSNTFLASNGVWSSTTNSVWNPQSNIFTFNTLANPYNVIVQLGLTNYDTLIPIPGTGSTTNTLWYGVNIPTGTTGGTYQATFNVVSSC